MEYQKHLQRELEIFYEITRAINASLSQQDVLAAMLNRIVEDLGYRAATLRLLDEEQQKLELKAYYGLSEAYLSKGAVELNKSGIDRTVLTGQVVTILDVRQESGFQYSTAAEREGLAGLAAVPLILHESVIGVLHVYTAEPHRFDDHEQAFLAGIASLGAQAIRRTHCFEAFQRLSHHINSSLDVKQVLKTLLLESVRELNVRAGVDQASWAWKENLHLASACGLSEAYLKKGEIDLAQSPIDRKVLKEGRPVAIADIAQEAAFQYTKEAERRHSLRACHSLEASRYDGRGHAAVFGAGAALCARGDQPGGRSRGSRGDCDRKCKIARDAEGAVEALKEDADGWYRFLSLG